MLIHNRRFLFILFVVIVAAAAGLWLMCPPATGPINESIKNPLFGTVHVYAETRQPEHIVILIGDSAWTPELEARAKAIASTGALVAGVSAEDFLARVAGKKGECTEVAKSFRKLTKFIERRYRYDDYVFPVLTGEGRGATLAYAALAQATPHVFAGAISFGFCPTLDLVKPFCIANNLHFTSAQNPGPARISYTFTKPSSMSEAWDIFPLAGDTSNCPASVSQAFVKNIHNGTMQRMKRDGQWPEVFGNRIKAMSAAQHVAVTDDVPGTLKDLPLNIMDIPAHRNKPLAIIVSGDGGWVRIDRGLGLAMNKRGIPVVGLDSLRYFWSPKTPDELGADLSRIIAHYQKEWSPSEIILVGYSRGADVLPFALTRLPGTQVRHIKSLALLAPGDTTKFKFEFVDWLPIKPMAIGTSVKAEILKSPPDVKILCFFGKDDSVTESVCPDLDPARYTIIEREGDHHFNEKYDEIVGSILSH